MAELINKDELLKKAVMIPGPSGKSVFSVVFTDDILNAKSIEPTTKNNLGVDCIDRVELLKAMDTWDKFGNDPNEGLIPLRTPALQDRYVPYVHYYDMVNCVKGMSSVTPQLSSGLEKNSKKLEKDFDELDCISRADAIKAMQDKAKELKNEDTINGLCGAVAILYKMPSITPIRPKGHWIETAEEYYKAVNEKGGGVNENTDYFVDDIACSECLAKFGVIDNEAERFDFCPCCGSENR